MNQYEKLTDLLADRALQGLSDDEQRELEILKAQYPELDEQEFERAAAAIQLTEAMKPEPLPKHLRSKIIADAEEFFGQKTASNVVAFPVQKVRHNYWQMVGWYAAAACLVLALIAGWSQVKEMFGEKPKAPSVAELRNELEKKSNDKVKISWSVTKFSGVENVQGDVVWSNEKQQGYMRFTNLPQNDPQQSVYQLWIFDENQDEKYPVDGGIFDAQTNGEIIVPIKAKLKVGKPTLFAITIEKPGGVVVSKRDKLILTAKIG
jgi:anti-sigma-K factor RskA